MLPRIDGREEGSTSRREVVERGWRDHPDGVLKRRCHMKRKPEVIRRRPAAVGDADRLHMLRAIAVGDLTILVPLDHGRGCMCHWFLADRGCYGSQGETTGQRGTAFEEFPSSRSFRTHGSL